MPEGIRAKEESCRFPGGESIDFRLAVSYRSLQVGCALPRRFLGHGNIRRSTGRSTLGSVKPSRCGSSSARQEFSEAVV